MNYTDQQSPMWLHTVYGTEASVLLSQLALTAKQIEKAVERFYTIIEKLPAANRILENLSADELSHLISAQTRYLVNILSPNISIEEHQRVAEAAGYRHYYVGLPAKVLAESSILYTDIANTLAKGSDDDEKLRHIISRRFQYDLIIQTGMYSTVMHQRLDVYKAITLQEGKGSSLDFIQSTLIMLLDTFDKDIAGLAFGQVRNGSYQHVLTQGLVPFDHVNEHTSVYPIVKMQKIEQAWFDEQSYIINSLHEETQIPEILRQECLDKGIRSFGFFILRDLQYVPKAYLLVCSKYPGYFMKKSMLYYWHQLADLIGSNSDFLERTSNKPHKQLASGIYYRQLLAKQKVEIHYQPIIDPDTGRTAKVEALARLKDDDRVIPPSEFLPVFGAHQLRELFEIGIAQILTDTSKLPVKAPLCNINLPPEVMRDRNWFQQLPEFLINNHMTPERLCLEVLESSLHDNKDVTAQFFALKEAGYSVFLDDVGAGESSLLRLVNLPVSGIKIDQRFVRSLRNSFANLDLILSLRFLALQRGLECVAEGVENMEIVDILSSMHGGGIMLQGYAFAEPMAATDLSEWIKQDDTRLPVPNTPQTLYGWYSRHVERLFTMRNALYTIPDLISIEQLQDAGECPLHAIIPQIGGDDDIVHAHQEWHTNYASFVAMIRSGTTAHELWQAMEFSKLKLQQLVEQKIRVLQLSENLAHKSGVRNKYVQPSSTSQQQDRPR